MGVFTTFNGFGFSIRRLDENDLETEDDWNSLGNSIAEYLEHEYSSWELEDERMVTKGGRGSPYNFAQEIIQIYREFFYPLGFYLTGSLSYESEGDRAGFLISTKEGIYIKEIDDSLDGGISIKLYPYNYSNVN